MIKQGNEVIDKNTAKATIAPQGNTCLRSDATSDKTLSKGKGAAEEVAMFVPLYESVMLTDLPLKQKVMLCYIMRQAHTQKTSTEIKVDRSRLMKVASLKDPHDFYPHINNLIELGYLSKEIITFNNGCITAYSLDTNKIERDFKIKIKNVN